MNQPNLQTNRLLLKAFSLSDALSVQKLAGDKRIADVTAHIPHPYPDGLAESWIASHKEEWESKINVIYAITLKQNNLLIGAIGLHKIKNLEGELGYWVGVPYWNQGYCTEAALKFLAYCFDKLQIKRIYAHHLTRNPASGRVLLKAGFSYCGKSTATCGYKKHEEAIEKYEVIN